MKKRIKKFLKRIKKVIFRPDMVLLPGQLAFFLVLAIVPTMTLITYGASILNLSTDFLGRFLTKAFSQEMSDLMLSVSTGTNVGLKLTIVILFCYYIASNGTNSVIVTSNTIYGIQNGNWFERRIKAIFMAIIFVLVLVFLLIVPVFGDKIVALITSVNLNQNITDIILKVFLYLESPLMWILLFFIIKLIYVMAPDRKIKAHNANYGALFTTISWILFTFFYSLYINNVANYSALYGGLTSVCVLMIWFYFLSYAFVIGMALNYQKEIEELEETKSIEINK